MNPHPDNKYIQGLLQNDYQILSDIYQEYRPKIIHFVLKNSGSEIQGKDLFQEALEAVLLAAHKGLVLNCTFYTYLYAVSRNLWLLHLKKRKHNLSISDTNKELIADNTDILNQLIEKELYELFFEKYDLLKNDCKKILTAYFEKTPTKTIALQLNYALDFVRLKVYRCKKHLIALVQKDNRFKDLNKK